MPDGAEIVVRESWHPLGRALLDYHRGDSSAAFVVSSSLWEDELTPVKDYYRPFSEALPEIESRALGLCRGHVLDLGAGAGRHSLELQQRGHRVTAVELNPDAVTVMRDRGVRSVRCADLYDIEGEQFDTVLLLMHGLGVVGTLAGLDRFLHHGRSLLAPGGRIVGDSADLGAELREAGASYPATPAMSGRPYLGEVSFHLRYGALVGPPYPWLFVDSHTLSRAAQRAGLNTEIVARGPRGAYLAVLEA